MPIKNGANQPKKDLWNVLIYMSADNNLSEEAVYALTEINRLEFDDRINVVAQFDSNVRGLKPKRYVFRNRGQASLHPARITSKQHPNALNRLSDLEDRAFPPKILG